MRPGPVPLRFRALVVAGTLLMVDLCGAANLSGNGSFRSRVARTESKGNSEAQLRVSGDPWVDALNAARQENWPEALRLVDRTMWNGRRSSEVIYFRALILLKLGRREEAHHLARTLVEDPRVGEDARRLVGIPAPGPKLDPPGPQIPLTVAPGAPGRVSPGKVALGIGFQRSDVEALQLAGLQTGDLSGVSLNLTADLSPILGARVGFSFQDSEESLGASRFDLSVNRFELGLEVVSPWKGPKVFLGGGLTRHHTELSLTSATDSFEGKNTLDGGHAYLGLRMPVGEKNRFEVRAISRSSHGSLGNSVAGNPVSPDLGGGGLEISFFRLLD